MGCAKSKETSESNNQTKPLSNRRSTTPVHSLLKLDETLSLQIEMNESVVNDQNTQDTPEQTPNTPENKRALNFRENLERMREARENFFKVNYNEPNEAITQGNTPLIMKTNFGRNLSRNLNNLRLYETPDSVEYNSTDNERHCTANVTSHENGFKFNTTPVTTHARGIRTECSSRFKSVSDSALIENKRIEKLLLRLLDCSVNHRLTPNELEELQSHLIHLFESLIACLNELKMTQVSTRRAIADNDMTFAENADIYIIEYREIIECIKSMKHASEKINFSLFTKCAVKMENANKGLKNCLIELENQKMPDSDKFKFSQEQLLNNHPRIKHLINQLDELNKQLPKTMFSCECPKTPNRRFGQVRPNVDGIYWSATADFKNTWALSEGNNSELEYCPTVELTKQQTFFESSDASPPNTPISLTNEELDKSLMLNEKYVLESENLIENFQETEDTSFSLPHDETFLKADEADNEENEHIFQSLGDFIKKNHVKPFESYEKPIESSIDTTIQEQTNTEQNKAETDHESQLDTENEPEHEHESIVALSVSSASEITVRDGAEIEQKMFGAKYEGKFLTAECKHYEIAVQSDMNNNELNQKEETQPRLEDEQKKKAKQTTPTQTKKQK